MGQNSWNFHIVLDESWIKKKSLAQEVRQKSDISEHRI